MAKTERQEQIIGIVNEQTSVSTPDIAERLSVSEMTVRRDLAELASQGRLVRVHGGARSVEGIRDLSVQRELTHQEKRMLHGHEKTQIATRALSLVDPGMTIFLGTGTTVGIMARLLPETDLRVISNSLPVLETLQDRKGISLVAIGGDFRPSTRAFIGPIAESTLSALGIDAAFLGVNGILGKVASTSNTPEGMLQRIALDRADRRYLLADSSKLDRRDFYDFYDVGDVDGVVTDRLISDDQRASLSELTTVIVA